MAILDNNSVRENILSALKSEGQGFSLDLKLTHDELATIRILISDQWLAVINHFSPELTSIFKKSGIENYHEVSHLVPHETLWPSLARTFSQKGVDQIRSLPFMHSLQSIFGDFTIADEEYIGRERILWRLVRPHQSSDVGPMHADTWFWELGYGDTPNNVDRIKVWIPIYSEAGLNGLNIVPGSHMKKWEHNAVMRCGVMKPQFDEGQVDLPIILPKTNPGDAIIFDDKLLHKGILNKGNKTRVSVEFTVFFKRCSIP